MSNIHTLSGLSKGSASSGSGSRKPAVKDTQIGSTVYHTINAGTGLQNAMATAAKSKSTNNLGTTKQVDLIKNRLGAAIIGGKEMEVDRQLAALSRQKQRVDLPMTPEVRQAAIQQRETIRPAKEVCPNGHKVPVAAAKKALTNQDVYVCTEKNERGEECGAMCGGEDAHPLHLELRMLSHADKNKYVDSVRWLSKSEVEVQTREYIKGHPLVFPHLAEGVLMNDETDAWLGYVLGWNIYYWFGDIARYWTQKRRELEAKHDSDEESDTQERGRGKRRKRKLAIEEEREAVAGDDEFEALPPHILAEVEAASSQPAEKKSRIQEPAASSSATTGETAASAGESS